MQIELFENWCEANGFEYHTIREEIEVDGTKINNAVMVEFYYKDTEPNVGAIKTAEDFEYFKNGFENKEIFPKGE